MLLALTTIAALCLAPRVRAGGGLPYPTAANVTQLVADFSYADANGGTFTINLQPGTTFVLTDGIAINGGTNAVAVTLIANGDTIERYLPGYDIRLFQVAQGASLTLDQATLTNGLANGANGGAIYNQGTLTVNNSIISGNVAQVDNYTGVGGFGGAIYNDFGATAVINSSTISGNVAIDQSGGGILNHGNLTLTDSTVSGCRAGGDFPPGEGGGIYSDGTLTVSGCTISGNIAGNGYGGGIFNSGTATISNTAVYNNSASFYDEEDGNDIVTPAAGGGVYNSGTLTIGNYSSFYGNSATDVYNAGTLNWDGTGDLGGGFPYPTATNPAQLNADIIYANAVGGTYTISLQPGTTFELELTSVENFGYGGYNGTTVIGGNVDLTIVGNGDTIERDLSGYDGIRLFDVAQGGSLTLDQVTLKNGLVDGYNGGAIYNHGALTLNNSTISGSAALTVTGSISGVVFSLGGFGGAIYNDIGGTTTMNNSIISGNSADQRGGGIYNAGTLTVESDSHISGNLYDDVTNLGVLYLDGTSTIGVLDGNSAIGLNPPLSIHSWSSAAHQLVLSWSTNYTGFTLQSSTDLGSTNWTDCASPTVSGASFVVTNPMSAGAQFFRLKR